MPILTANVKQNKKNVIFQVAGILLGFIIMMLVSFYELLPSDCT